MAPLNQMKKRVDWYRAWRYTFFMNRTQGIAKEWIKRCYHSLRDISVPPLCMICDAILVEPGGCCSACWSKVRFIAPPLCDVTGRPFSHDLGDGIVSADAIANPPPFARCRSAVIYNDHVRSLVTGLKYSDRTDLAPWMAKWMVTAGRDFFAETADMPIVVPVPLHPMRMLERRFNQSAELARHIAQTTKAPYHPELLTRPRATRQQVGLSSKERERNVQGAFKIPVDKKIDVAGRRILLIDDVYTSGATVKSAARALKRGGVKQVDVLTFARVENLED